MQRRSYKAGEVIFETEEHPSEAYILMSGTVEIHRGDFAAELQRGEVFGESALMGHPRMASAVALRSARIFPGSFSSGLPWVISPPR